MSTAAEGAAPPTSRSWLTIQAKLSGVILALVAALVALFATVTTAREINGLEADLERRAHIIASLAADQLRAAIGFDDHQTEREVLASLSVDPDVAAVGLFDAAGKVIEVRGELGPIEPPVFMIAASLTRDKRVVAARAPVVSLEGPRGTLLLHLSTAAVARKQDEALRAALTMGVGALLVGLLCALQIGRSFARRVRVVADTATAVAAGDLGREPITDNAADEIGEMARAFNGMLTHIRELVAQIQGSAKEEAVRLERLVAERTVALHRRNAELLLVLDNVEQGFVTLDREGRPRGEHSRAIVNWFGPLSAQMDFAGWVFSRDAEAKRYFELGWEAMCEGFMPLDVMLEQLGRRVHVGSRIIDINYRLIIEDDEEAPSTELTETSRVLVVMTDVTSEVARARAEIEQRELGAVFERFGRDRASVLSAFEEGGALVARICDARAGGSDRARDLHTLKGSAGLVGLGSISTLAHELEDALDAEARLSEANRGQLQSAWEEVERRFGFLLRAGRRIEIDDADLEIALRALGGSVPRVEVARLLETWRCERVNNRLEQLAEQAHRIGRRLGKLPLDVAVDSGDVRLAPGALSEFWSAFVHVVRNAVDHGLETPAEREAAGKAAIGRLSLRASVQGDGFVLEVEDQGRGVDWEAARQKARAAGLPAETAADLVEALCSDGFSTAAEVTDLSGRGIGLGAVRAACIRAGGLFELASERGRGTLVRFRFPAARVGAFAAEAPRTEWSPSGLTAEARRSDVAGSRS
jgi:two-component system chemotaxis sensor kinase CheA